MSYAAAVLYKAVYDGRLPRLNEKFGARSVRQKARLFTTGKYKRGLSDMAAAFAAARTRAKIDFPVDCTLEVSMWKMLDTDAPIKAIMDALEAAGVLKDDRQIRHLTVLRRYHKRDSTDRVVVQLFAVGER
jgi:Holliday junction resolvase RusA-like endonuclease